MEMSETIDKVLAGKFADDSVADTFGPETIAIVDSMQHSKLLPSFLKLLIGKGPGTTIGGGFILGIECQKEREGDLKKEILAKIPNLEDRVEVESFLNWLKVECLH